MLYKYCKFSIVFIVLSTCFTFFCPIYNYAEIELNKPSFIYKAKGDYFRRLGLLNKALNQYDKALAIKNDFPECHYWSAIIYKKKHLYTQALFEIKSALHFKDKFQSVTRYFDTLFLEAEIYFFIYDTNQSKLNEEEKQGDLIIKVLEQIVEELEQSKNRLGKKEFNLYLKYQLGKWYFYKAKLYFKVYKGDLYCSKNILDKEKLLNSEGTLDREKMFKETVRYFNQAAHSDYRPALGYYYKCKFLNEKARQTFNKKERQELSKEAKQAKEKALKLNPNVILDFNRLIDKDLR